MGIRRSSHNDLLTDPPIPDPQPPPGHRTTKARKRRLPMKCPTCRLVNPDTALRCDCGYDFQSGKMEQPYHDGKTSIPRWVGVVLSSQGAFWFLFARGGEGASQNMPLFLTWVAITALLYFMMAKGKNGARIALAIWAFPLGLSFLLSSDLKAFIRKRSNF